MLLSGEGQRWWWQRPGDAVWLQQRTTSRVVTPNSLPLSYTPASFSTSAAIGTVELTGLEMMLSHACTAAMSKEPCKACTAVLQHAEPTFGQCWAQALMRSLTMLALICSTLVLSSCAFALPSKAEHFCCTAYLEKIVSGHAGLAGHPSWDDDQVTALQGLPQLLRPSIALPYSQFRHGCVHEGVQSYQCCCWHTLVLALELMWLISAATPGVPAIS